MRIQEWEYVGERTDYEKGARERMSIKKRKGKEQVLEKIMRRSAGDRKGDK